MAFKCGPMVPSMKDFGLKIWLVDMEGSFWLMEICTKETGLMIKHTVKEIITMLKVQCTKEDGLKINKKAKAEKNGQMEVSTKVSI